MKVIRADSTLIGVYIERSQFVIPGLWVNVPGRLSHERASCDTNEFKIVQSDSG